jgi:hypothetical protein
MRSKLDLSHTAYCAWKNTNTLKLDRFVFIEKKTMPDRFLFISPKLTDLFGYLPIQYAASQINVTPHVFNFTGMKLHSQFEYRFVDGVKFVNIHRFFKENGIVVNPRESVSVGKLDSLIITPNCRFYGLNNDYGVVVYS